MPRPAGQVPEFTCVTETAVDRRYCQRAASAFVFVDRLIHAKCEEHVGPFIVATFAVDPRAKISVRNPATWHVRRAAGE